MSSLHTPVLFIVFNRIDTAARVFEAIKAAKPRKLYIAADGPRKKVAGEEQKCMEARRVADKVDWDCELKTFFRDENDGTRYGIVKAIDWFFSHEEEGIILEHDCLPSPFFFEFCAELLAHFRHDHRVMHIGGTNLQFGQKRGDAAYYFSRIASIWGWAGWRRVWQGRDYEMTQFPLFEAEDQMINLFPERRIADWATAMARSVYEKKLVTWDYPYAFSILCNNGLSIVPNENLVSNIGFGAGATHTQNENDIHAAIPFGNLHVITHPEIYVPDSNADLFQLKLSVEQVTKQQLKKVQQGVLSREKERTNFFSLKTLLQYIRK
jgi:hypothetical protein